MLTKERKHYIMELLNRDYFVSIKQLMNLLDVSRSSVMRDLDELEQEGLIVRERGGASLLVSDAKHNEPAVREKEHTNEFQKRKICQMAAMSIKDGDCIFIDSGTTAIYIVDYVLDKNVDIVTPNTY
ncbi:MAG: DeoR family transcriptional regulator, partial [Floccifex sp.]